MAKNYVAPDFKKDSFTCPHCGTLSLVHYHTISYQGCTVVVSKSGIINNGDSSLHVATCQNCKKKIIWVDNVYVYPDIVAEEANPDMPESVKQLYNEAGSIYSKSPRAACALLRLAIDDCVMSLVKQTGILVRISVLLWTRGCQNLFSKRWM